MKNLKPFLLKLLALAFMLAVVDLAAGLLFHKLFFKQKSGKYFTATHALKNATEDIAIFGNSHAAQHFDAPLMQKETGKTVFNFGNQGQGLFYVSTIIKSMLRYHQPKLIVLNVDYEELRYDHDDYARLSILLPYYHTNSLVDSAIAMSGKYEEIKANSSLYKYNSLLGYMLLNTYKPSYNKSMASLGFDPNPGILSAREMEEARHPKADTVFHFDRAKIRCFASLIDFIHANHVQLLVTTTPLFHHNNLPNLYKDKLYQLLNQAHVDYFDAGNDPAFQDQPGYFHDGSHLNDQGAILWTKECVKYINRKGYLR